MPKQQAPHDSYAAFWPLSRFQITLSSNRGDQELIK